MDEKYLTTAWWNTMGFYGPQAVALSEFASAINLVQPDTEGAVLWNQVEWPGTAQMLRRKQEFE